MKLKVSMNGYGATISLRKITKEQLEYLLSDPENNLGRNINLGNEVVNVFDNPDQLFSGKFVKETDLEISIDDDIIFNGNIEEDWMDSYNEDDEDYYDFDDENDYDEDEDDYDDEDDDYDFDDEDEFRKFNIIQPNINKNDIYLISVVYEKNKEFCIEEEIDKLESIELEIVSLDNTHISHFEENEICHAIIINGKKYYVEYGEEHFFDQYILLNGKIKRAFDI